MDKLLVEADAGDYHFELRKEGESGEFSCLRSDISDPARIQERVVDLQEIPPAVSKIFTRFMH